MQRWGWGLAVLGAIGCGNVLRTQGPPQPGDVPAITSTPLSGPLDAEGRVRIVELAGRSLDWSGLAAATGCTPEVATFRTSYAVWSAAHEQPYDVVIAPTDISRRLMRDDVVRPLNPDLVDDWSALPAWVRNAPWNAFDDRPFGVPLQWGPQGLLVRTDVFETPPATWRALYEALPLLDGTSTAGRIQAYEGPISFATTVLALRAHDPEHTDIADPYAVTKSELGAGLRAIRLQNPIVGTYWQDPDQQVQSFVDGRAIVASSWHYQARALEAQGLPVQFTVPDAGATAWALTGLVSRDADHPGCAYRTLAYALTPEVQRAHAEALAAVPMRTEACNHDGDDLCAAYGAAERDRLHFWRSPDRQCGRAEDCMAWHEWIGRVTLVRGGIP